MYVNKEHRVLVDAVRQMTIAQMVELGRMLQAANENDDPEDGGLTGGVIRLLKPSHPNHEMFLPLMQSFVKKCANELATTC